MKRDEAGGSVYVQCLKVNWQIWNQSWVSHEQLTVGEATLEFVLGLERVNWDTGELTPSPEHVDLGS